MFWSECLDLERQLYLVSCRLFGLDRLDFISLVLRAQSGSSGDELANIPLSTSDSHMNFSFIPHVEDDEGEREVVSLLHTIHKTVLESIILPQVNDTSLCGCLGDGRKFRTRFAILKEILE
jgi:hypothetical protein